MTSGETNPRIGIRRFELVLGRIKDSSSHDSILFAFFAGEREDSARVISGEGSNWCKSLNLKQQKKIAKWKEKLLENAFFGTKF
jgi:hypothetical protein